MEPDDNYCMREEQFYAWAYYTYSLMSCAWQSKVEWEEYILVPLKSPLEQIQLPTKKSALGCSKPNVPELAGEKFPGEEPSSSSGQRSELGGTGNWETVVMPETQIVQSRICRYLKAKEKNLFYN